MTVYGDLVERHGLAASHAMLLDEVPAAARVLDVGCGEGHLARVLTARGCEVVGVEAQPEAAACARARCAALVEGDVEEAAVRDQVAGPFDRVLLGDVLEHLRDPQAVLRWSRGLLAPDGLVVASIPNVAHWTARRELLRGRFPQRDHGLFDRTHLHFYTRETARRLVEGAGLRVVRERFAPAPLPLESRLPALARLQPVLVQRRPELFALQVVLTCTAA